MEGIINYDECLRNIYEEATEKEKEVILNHFFNYFVLTILFGSKSKPFGSIAFILLNVSLS